MMKPALLLLVVAAIVAFVASRLWARATRRWYRYPREERARRPRYSFIFRKHGWRRR